jgi:hypothetical protein
MEEYLGISIEFYEPGLLITAKEVAVDIKFLKTD